MGGRPARRGGIGAGCSRDRRKGPVPWLRMAEERTQRPARTEPKSGVGPYANDPITFARHQTHARVEESWCPLGGNRVGRLTSTAPATSALAAYSLQILHEHHFGVLLVLYD